jgi:hypothetical protein
MICNYCGRTWHIKLCPRGHENPFDALYCRDCGSVELSEPAGPRSWWHLLHRALIWGLLIMIVISIGSNLGHFVPILLVLLLPIACLFVTYLFMVEIAPRPLKGLLQYVNGKLKLLALWLLTMLWNIMKKILCGR